MTKTVTKSKKKILILAITIMMLFTMLNFTYAASDISDHWGRDVIQDWLDKGLISGYPDGSFKPDKEITRAEFMALVNKAFGYTETTTINYSDVKSDAWYYETIAIAKAAGYIDGYPDGTMRPNNSISREEAATIIMKIYKLTPNEEAANALTDADKFTWSKGAIGAVVSNNIMTGYPDGTFGAQIFIKRVEATVSLDRGNKQFNDTEDEEETEPVTPEIPDVTIDDDDDTVAGLTTAMEYKLDSGSWKMYVKSTFDALDLSGNHTLQVRYAAEGINPYGPSVTLEFTKKVTTSSGGGGGGGGGGGSTIRVTDITLTGDDTVDNSFTLQLAASVLPANATNKTITWTVTTLLGGTATIDSTGLLTATGPGTVTVTARNATSGVTETKVITITNIAIPNATAAVLAAEDSYLQDDLDDAQDLVTALPTSAAKTTLQGRIDAAQIIIDANTALDNAKATVPVDLTIYTDATALVVTNAVALSEDTTQEKIDKTAALVSAVEGLITKASVALEEATAAVVTAETSGLQADVTTAQGLVSALTDGDDKTALQGRLDVIQTAINLVAAKLAAHTALTNALATYSNDDYTGSNWSLLVGYKTNGDTAIDAATLVADVTSARNTATNGMAAVETIAETEAIATAAVVTAEGTKLQEDVNTAQGLVTALPDGAAKTALQIRIDAVQDIIDFQVATAAVVTAEASNEQDDVTDAEELVALLPDSAGKDSLEDRLAAVQRIINATTAVTLAESTLTQANHDSALAMVNILPNGDIKTALLGRLTLVQGTINLNSAKTTALGTLATTYGTYSSSNYETDDWTTLAGYYTSGQTAINAATSIADVNTALSTAESNMDGVLTSAERVANAKTAAHGALNTALAVYKETDYTAENWTTLNDAKTAGDTAIDAATTLSGVTSARDNALTNMANVLTIAQTLALAKSTAYSDLNTALSGYAFSDYTTENWTLLTGYKATGDDEIFDAADLTAVATARQNALDNMADVPTIAETLLATKEDAQEELQTEFDKYDSKLYTGTNWTILLGFKTEGDSAINSSGDLVEVDAALQIALNGMDAVLTMEETELAAVAAVVYAENNPTQNNINAALVYVNTLPEGVGRTSLLNRLALVQAKVDAMDDLNTTLGTYVVTDYSSANWTALNTAKTDGDTAIRAAATTANVTSAKDAAIAAMGAVKTLAEELEDAKTAAHTELSDTMIARGYIEANYSATNWNAMVSAKGSGDSAINDALTIGILSTIIDNALDVMDAIPTYTEELAAAKTTAHDALTSALATYVQTDYTEENWTTLTKFKTDGDTAIDAAESLGAVATAQTTATNGMAGVDSIADTLDDAKTAAKTALSDAVTGYTEGYTSANWIALTGYKIAGDAAIDAATTVADVTTAKNAAIAAMDAVKTIAELEADATAAVGTAETTKTQENVNAAQSCVDLLEESVNKTALQDRIDAVQDAIDFAQAHLDAHTALTTALSGYTQANYTSENWTTLTGFKTTGDTAIDAATTVAEVETAQTTATSGMAGVQTIAGTLAAQKLVAKNDLQTAYTTNYHEADYTTSNWTILTNYKNNGDVAIDNATTSMGVSLACSNAISQMTGVQTIAQTLAANKTSAKAELQTYYDGYHEADYSAANWITLTGYKDAGDDAIDAATDSAGVVAARNAAYTNILNVDTYTEELDLTKTAAHLAVENAYSAYDSEDYSGYNWMALENIRLQGDSNIYAAVSLEVVETEKDNAIDGMDAVRTIVETEIAADAAVTLAQNNPTEENIEDAYALILELPDGIAKTSLSNRLHTAAENAAMDDLTDAYAAYDSDDYTAENWDILDSYFDQGQIDIAAATTLAQIQAAYGTAIAAMADVPTIATGDAWADFNNGINVTNVDLLTAGSTFDPTNAIITSNWTLGGTNVADLGEIYSIALSVSNTRATIITDHGLIDGRNYTITPAQAAMSVGCDSPGTMTIRIIPIPIG